MTWRKWMVRGLVLGIASSLALSALLVELLTNPTAMREQVIARIGEHLVDVTVNLDAARLRLLGGIAFRELRLRRNDDNGRTDFLYVPSGVIYHDKEQLLDGTVAIRKIELERPLIRATRRPDGRWNLAGILQPPDFERRKPTIVIQNGTILIDDQPGQPPLVIQDVSLTIINDPIVTLNFHGGGYSDLLGRLQMQGSFRRDTDRFAGTFKTIDVALGETLLRRIGFHVPQVLEYSQMIDARARLDVGLQYDPDSTEPWSHELTCELSDGTVRHPKLPLPITELQATLRGVEGQLSLDKLTGRFGKARLTANGRLLKPTADADCGLAFTLEHLEINRALLDRLPPKAQEIERDYQPEGPATLECRLNRASGVWQTWWRLEAEGLKARFHKFPYPLTGVRGSLVQEIDPARNVDVLRIDVVGLAGEQPVYVRGTVEGSRPAGVDLNIWGRNMVLDERLQAALPAGPRKIAADFNPRGLVDVVATIRRPQGVEEFTNSYRLEFHDASVRYRVFPYPIEGIRGILEIRPDHWEYRDFRGTHKGAEFTSSGRSEHTPHGERIVIDLRGNNALFDAELGNSLQPGLRQAWDTLRPAGRFDFHARVDHFLRNPEPEFDVTVRPRGSWMQPIFFPYALDQITGTIRYYQQKVYLEEIIGRHGRTQFAIHRGDAQIKPGGGVFVDIPDFEGYPIVPDADLVQALPPVLRGLFNTLGLRDPLALRTQLKIDVPPAHTPTPPTIAWDGKVRLESAKVHAGVDIEGITGQASCRGQYHGKLEYLLGNLLFDEVRLFNQPMRAVHSQVIFSETEPHVFRFPNLKGQLFGGNLGGEIKIELEPETRFSINLVASQVQLEELGRQNVMPSAEISGLATARLTLGGDSRGVAGLYGRGTVDVPNGRMYNLPLLLDLLKVTGLRLPDRTAFEEAHAHFMVQGPRVQIQKVDLYGNAISLSGQGEMALDGSDINLEFHAVGSRLGDKLMPTPVKEIVQEISECLFKIKMQGRIGDVRCTKEPLPILFDPFRELWQRMQLKQARVQR